MHYYKRNLGDYAKKAGRLTMLQHGAYNLLLDACYDRERFPTRDEAIDWAWAASAAEIEAVEFVLRKFFTLTDGVYVQERIQQELDEFAAKSAKNKQIAHDRETKRARNVDEASPAVDESSPNQEPRTTNQEPEKQKPPADKPPKKSKRQLAAEYPLPDWIDRALWARWIEGRTKPEAGLPENVAKLAAWRQQGHDPAHILREAIASGWQGLFLTKGTSHEDRRSTSAGSAVERVQAAIAAGRAAREYPGPDPSAIDGTVVASHG